MRGFTLVELLVTLSLVLILAGFALPAASTWVSSHQARAEINGMFSMVQSARHAAISLGVPVTLCPQPVNTADPECGARNTWHLGMVAFVDRNGNRRIDEQDYVVANRPAMKQGKFYWRSFRNRSYLRFTARGITDWQNGHFLYCSADGELKHARQMVLNASGRVYFSHDHDNDGVHEDVSGDPLSCP